jgi:predicted DNA-binding transcriptional regulator AlpA
MFQLINQDILASYAKAQQAYIQELVREAVEQAKQHTAPTAEEEDKMLTAEEAAKVLASSADWLYRNANKLPFARKLGPKMLRFSQRGLNKWVEQRRVKQ